MNAPAKTGVPFAGLGELKLPGPGGLTIGQVALGDPRLAYALLGQLWSPGPLLAGGIVDGARLGACCGWGWEIIDVAGCFTVGDCGKTVLGKHSQITGDLFVRKVVYTVRRPNFAQGNGFKGQWDHFNALNPNIDVEIQINSYCRYLINEFPTPIENIPVMFDCECPPLFLLRCNASILARFTNRRAFAQSELPVDVVVSFHTIRLPISYDSCAYGEAVGWLTRNGVCCGPPAELQPGV